MFLYPDICGMLNRIVGKNLKKLRKLNNYSQEKVEIALDISRSTLGKIENGVGRIDLDRLEKFAKFFKVDVLTILTMPNQEGYDKELIDPGVLSEKHAEYGKKDVDLAKYKEKTAGLKKELSYLKAELKNAKSQIKDKDMIIALMNKKKS